MNKKNKQQIIFLDVDGVLTSRRCNGFYDFDLWAVHFFKWVCKESGAKIVMSSAWRNIRGSFDTFSKVFEGDLHEDWRTGILNTRGDEILEWLSRHPEVGNFVAVDDDIWDLDEVAQNTVQTSTEDGLLSAHMWDIKTRLGVKGQLPRQQKVWRDDVCFYTTREKPRMGFVTESERFARNLVQEAADEVN